jgi:hypothetical protein
MTGGIHMLHYVASFARVEFTLYASAVQQRDTARRSAALLAEDRSFHAETL